MNKIVSVHTCHEGLRGAFKSPAILVSTEPNNLQALAYLRKPTGLTNEQFRAVVRDIFSQIKGLSEDTILLLEDKQDE